MIAELEKAACGGVICDMNEKGKIAAQPGVKDLGMSNECRTE
jgi:hypothetical protein